MKRILRQPEKRWLVWIILTGGSAVLASYLGGIIYQAGSADIVWGGISQGIRPIYAANVLLAAGFSAL